MVLLQSSLFLKMAAQSEIFPEEPQKIRGYNETP